MANLKSTGGLIALHRYKSQTLFLLACIVLALLSTLLSFESYDDETTRRTSWQLPEEMTIELTSDLNTMLSKPLFGGEPTIIEPPPPPQIVEKGPTDEWQLLGIVVQGDHWKAVYKNQGTNRVEVASTGDILPSGEELTTVSHTSIEVLGDTGYRKISLFHNTDKAETEQ